MSGLFTKYFKLKSFQSILNEVTSLNSISCPCIFIMYFKSSLALPCNFRGADSSERGCTGRCRSRPDLPFRPESEICRNRLYRQSGK